MAKAGDVTEPARILQPLSIYTITSSKNNKKNADLDDIVPCLFCESTFPASENGAKNPVLAHLLSVHKLVIADVEKVANFPSYIHYWKEKFANSTDLTKYCVVINTNTAPDDKAPQEKYFLLTDFLPEDQAIRDKLKSQKLVKILDEQQLERSDSNFSKRCLFCKVMFHGNRSGVFRHMAKDHSFNIGNADNIVHATEFLDSLKSKLDSFTCLFCEKQFKDWAILKDHMRKKGHKRIDPKNKEYDKYYVINYLEPGKDWKEIQTEPEYERENIEEEDENITNEKEWEDWTEDNGVMSLCLFCSKTNADVYKILDHMKNEHDFDFHSIKTEKGLNFYHQVKIVNYVRKQVYQKKCPMCLEDLKTKDKLELHLSSNRHCGLPSDQMVWDQPGYFFSTFDDDSLLCFLEDDGEEDENQNIKS